MTRLRRPSALLAAALGALALGGAAATTAGGQTTTPAADTFTFTGSGWGHGVGMSQYGARGRALAGWDAARILRHYYTGTKLSVVKKRTVRVLLSDGRASVAVSSPTPWRAVGLRPNGRRTTPLRAGQTYILKMLPDGRLALHQGTRRTAVFSGPVRLLARAKEGWVAWGRSQPESGNRYRGSLRAVPSGGSFDLVNVVDLEDYLRGVVPREMPASWGDDALPALVAQSVAARTYAIATLKPTADYDLFNDDRSQVYGGVSAEDPRASRAVLSTRGTVLTYDGEIITAFYFSTSGGRTEDVQNVFRTTARPYLKSVPDPYDRISPYHVWPDPPTFTAARLGSLLGLDGPVTDVTVVRRGVSPRVLEARVTTRSGSRTTLTGTSMRSSLGLRDTWFTVAKNARAATGRR